MRLAILGQCDSLVIGNTVAAMACALTRAKNETVTLITMDTSLYGDVVRTGDYHPPQGEPTAMKSLLFPQAVVGEDGLLHPARLKRHGERLFKDHGISMLYACQVIGYQDGIALLAHKSGLYGYRCKAIYHFPVEETLNHPAYCLHTLDEGKHIIKRVPVDFVGSTAREIYKRYAQALGHVSPGQHLARGGYAAGELTGINLGDSWRTAENATPCTLPWPAGHKTPQFDNPLYALWPTEIVLGVQPGYGGKYDVIVVGGGTAGACAALYAARQGMRTLLLEMNHCLGGTGTAGGVSCYWFGLRDSVTKEIDQAVARLYQQLGLPRSPGLWSQDDAFLPDLKAHVLLGLCLDAGVVIQFGALACGVEKIDQRIRGVYYAQGGTLMYASCEILIDCTGDGDVCMFAGADHTYGNAQDSMTYWASLAQYPSPCNYRNNFSTMVHLGDPLDYSRFIQAARLLGEGMYDHGSYVAVRESRHIKGLETITLEDIVAMKPVKDSLYACFSNYDPKGRLTADMVYFGFLPPNQVIPIPRGALIPVDAKGQVIQGLLVGGKAISCTHDAFPPLRMQPDLQRQGMALGVLAACAIQQNVPVIDTAGVREELIKYGEKPIVQGDDVAWDIESIVVNLSGAEPWEWLDAPVTSFEQTASPIVKIMLTPADEALPYLRKAYRQPGSAVRRLTLARLMLWHGDEDGAQMVIDHIWHMLEETAGLPKRTGSVNYGQLLPDHGLMPEAVYLLNSLSRSRTYDVFELFSEVVNRLAENPRDWMDLRCGIYCYCESVAYVASGRKDTGMLPLLRRLLAFSEFQQEAENPLLSERFIMLKSALLSAMHQLGDPQGTKGLKALQHHPKRIIAQAANMLLDEKPV